MRWMRPQASRVLVGVDRSSEVDKIGFARVIKKDPSKMVVLYQGTKRVRFVWDSGSVRCVKCGKAKSTIRGAQKHYKRAHGD